MGGFVKGGPLLDPLCYAALYFSVFFCFLSTVVQLFLIFPEGRGAARSAEGVEPDYGVLGRTSRCTRFRYWLVRPGVAVIVVVLLVFLLVCLFFVVVVLFRLEVPSARRRLLFLESRYGML